MTTPTTVQVKIQLRGDTAANWASVNPVLLNNELGLETDTKKLKVGNGSTAWNSLAYFPSIVTGGTVLGNLEIGTTGTLTFEGSTADGFETTLGVINPTADRTINLPNQSGTVIVSGNATIVDADIAANAEIAVSKLADGAARQLLQTDAAGTGVEWTDNVDVPGTLDVTGAATFDAAVTIAGDLTVNGTTTNINTTNLVVEDKNIILGDVATPTDTTADGGGITLKGATDKTINWSDTTDSWTFNQPTITTGSSTAASFIPTGSTVPTNGVYLPSANNVAISTNGTGRLFVDSSGNVGIGTSTAPSTNGLGLAIYDASLPRLTFRNSTTGDGTGDGTQLVQDGLNFNFANTESGSIKFFTANTERAVIDSSGRLGLGTSSPGSRLDVRDGDIFLYKGVGYGSSADINYTISTFAEAVNNNAAYQYRLNLAGNENGQNFSIIAKRRSTTDLTCLTVNGTSGNVGIGTTAPTTNLALSASDNYPFIHWNNSSNTTIAFLGWHGGTGGGDDFRLGTVGTKAVTFQTNNTERARIDSSGRLLVGTSSDSGGALLQVNGDRVRIATAKTPASASDTGTTGEICWDANYIYVCTATNTWKRSAISTW
jgi:hypothetical protein